MKSVKNGTADAEKLDLYNSEASAFIAQKAFTDSGFIAKLVRGDTTVAEKILRKIADVKDSFGRDSAERKYFAAVEKMYLDAIEEAGMQYRGGKIIGGRKDEEDSIRKSVKYLDNTIDSTEDVEYNENNELYTSTADFLMRVKKADISDFTRKLANNTSGMQEGETRYLTFYCPNSAYYFIADGYMHGVLFDSISIDEMTRQNNRRKYYDRNYSDGKNVDSWNEITSSFGGRSMFYSISIENGGAEERPNYISDGSSKGNKSGNNERSRIYNWSHEEIKELIEKLEKMYGVKSDEKRDRTSYDPNDIRQSKKPGEETADKQGKAEKKQKRMEALTEELGKLKFRKSESEVFSDSTNAALIERVISGKISPSAAALAIRAAERNLQIQGNANMILELAEKMDEPVEKPERQLFEVSARDLEIIDKALDDNVSNSKTYAMLTDYKKEALALESDYKEREEIRKKLDRLRSKKKLDATDRAAIKELTARREELIDKIDLERNRISKLEDTKPLRDLQMRERRNRYRNPRKTEHERIEIEKKKANERADSRIEKETERVEQKSEKKIAHVVQEANRRVLVAKEHEADAKADADEEIKAAQENYTKRRAEDKAWLKQHYSDWYKNKAQKVKAKQEEEAKRNREENNYYNERINATGEYIKAERSVLDKAQKIKDWKAGTFLNAAQYRPDIFKGSIEKLARINNHGNLNQTGTRHIVEEIYQWYVANKSTMTKEAFDEDIAVMMYQIANGNKIISDAERKRVNEAAGLYSRAGNAPIGTEEDYYGTLLDWYTRKNVATCSRRRRKQIPSRQFP